MPKFEGQELQSQMQLKDVSEKLQISPFRDVFETLYETSKRCI